MADSEETVTEFLSEDTETASPKAPALPPTLIRSVRNCSNDAMSMMASSTCALCVRGNRTDAIYRMIIESLNVSLRFATVREREYTKSSDSRAYISPPSDGGGGLERRQKKNASLSDFDAKTMRAKESTRTGRVQSTTNDWTFLDPFFAAGAIFMFDFFLSV